MIRRAAYRAIAATAVALACNAGCIGSATTSGGKKDAGTDTGPIVDMAQDPKLVFTTTIQPLIVADCGSCHAQPNGSYPPFLVAGQGSDVYTTFTAWPNMVGTTPETSRILTKATHEGPSYADGSSAAIKTHAPLISDWIKLYNAAGGKLAGSTDMAVQPTLTPVDVTSGTLQTISLSELGSVYAGMTLTFTPKVSGTILNIQDITLTGTATSGVALTGMVIAIYAADLSTAENIDTDFYTNTYTAYAGTPSVIGTSLRPYTAGQKIGFSVSSIALATGMPDMGGNVGMCKDVPDFSTFKPFLTGKDGAANLSRNCTSCHNSGPGGFNTTGFTMATNDATSCAQVLLLSNATTPAMSAVYTAISGTGQHTGGKLTAQEQTDFLAGLTTWLAGEK